MNMHHKNCMSPDSYLMHLLILLTAFMHTILFSVDCLQYCLSVPLLSHTLCHCQKAKQSQRKQVVRLQYQMPSCLCIFVSVNMLGSNKNVFIYFYGRLNILLSFTLSPQCPVHHVLPLVHMQLQSCVYVRGGIRLIC